MKRLLPLPPYALLLLSGLACLLVSAAWALYESRDWNIIHDIALMSYFAQRVRSGDVPYADVLEMPFPAVYAIHIAQQWLLGESDAGFRLFDLLWLAATCAAIGVFLRREGGFAAVTAMALFAICHLSFGNITMGQRDFLICLFVIGALQGVSRFLEGAGQGMLLLSGLCLGAAASVKPSMAPLWLLLVACVGPAIPPARRIRHIMLLTAACLVAPALSLLWLAAEGGLAAFVDMTFHYTFGPYGAIRRSVKDMIFTTAGYASGFLPLLLLPVRPRVPHLQTLAVLGVFAGVCHALSQGKGWDYHMYPMLLCLCLLGGMRAGAFFRCPAELRAVCLGLWFATVAFFSPLAVLADRREPIGLSYIRVLMDDIRTRIAPQDTVQVMDTTWGGLNALFRLHLRQPTRFLVDAPFYMGDTPYIQRIRAEFVAALAENPPRLMVVMRQLYPVERDGYYRTRHFPALQSFIDTRYHTALERPEYIIYERNAPIE